MLEKIETVQIGIKEYPVIFTLNILEKIQEIYGSMDKWNSLLFGVDGQEPSIKVIIWTFNEMMNEAIDITNIDTEVKQLKLEHKQVGRIIGQLGLKGALAVILKLLSSQAETDEQDPNEKANPMQK